MGLMPKALIDQIAFERLIGKFDPLPPLFAGPGNLSTSREVSVAYCVKQWVFTIANIADTSTISEIRQIVNGDIFKSWVGDDLDYIHQYNGDVAFATNLVLVIDEERPRLRSSSDGVDFSGKNFISGSAKNLSLSTALNCGSKGPNGEEISSVKFEFYFNATGAVAPVINLKAIAIPPQAGGPGALLRVDKQIFNMVLGPNTLNKNQALKIGDALRRSINRIYLKSPFGTTLDNFEVWWNGQQWRIESAAEMAQLAGKYGWNAAATIPVGLYVLDFQREGWGDTMLPVAESGNDVQVNFTSSAAGPLTVYQESLGLSTPPAGSGV